MATIKNGILGGLSGKVGNVVGGTWKGISYLRALPSHVTQANSPAQLSARQKMSLVSRFLKTCVPLVRIGFSGFAQKMSAYNAATSYNFHYAVGGDYPDHVLDYPSLVVARGNLAGGEGAGCTSTEAGKVTFSWNDNSGTGNASTGDTAMLLVFNPAKESSMYLLQAASRSDGSAEVNVPVGFTGDEVHCYLAFADLGSMVSGQAREHVSNSVYAGAVAVA